MKLKMIIRGALLGVLGLAAASCFGKLEGGSKYEGTLSVHYEPDYAYQLEDYLHTFFNDGADTVSVARYLSVGPLTHYSEVDDAGALVGGFAMCIGLDTLAAPDRKPSRFAVFDKGGYQESMAYAVYHDTLAALMPEHAIKFSIPNDESSCVMTHVYVQNVQAAVQAALYGTGLAGGPFTAEDHLTLTITGSRKEATTGSKSVKLLDGTRVLGGWTEMDLSGLGSVDVLDIRLESSRPDFPLYCCLDDITFHYSEIY